LKKAVDLEAVRVVCIEAGNMLRSIVEKVPQTNPHGVDSRAWLANIQKHLGMILEDVVEEQKKLGVF
jgi:hypothetical protein